MARTKIRHLPSRLSAGTFILNSGLGKLEVDDETAKRIHGMAVGTYPFLDRVEPRMFVKLLAVSEIALGSALVVPLVPSRYAGLGLSAFAAALLGMYMKTPGMRLEGSIRPSQQGTALAKDVWMLGIGASLVIDRAKGKAKGKRSKSTTTK
jgi:hypothetical protein